jgi:hypothetical protein
MSDAAPDRISVTSNPTFWELLMASLLSLKYRPIALVVFAAFPLAGLFLLLTPLMGYRLGMQEILMAFSAFAYTPLIMALSIWTLRRRNKLAQGPFTYSFDAEGMHTSGAAFKNTVLWAAIPRIRCSRRFLFIFISPRSAHCIPLHAITDPRFLDELRKIAGNRTDVAL